MTAIVFASVTDSEKLMNVSEQKGIFSKSRN